MNSFIVQSKDLWDSFVQLHAPQSFFAGFTWGEVEEKLGHSPIYMGWGEDNHLKALALVTVVRAKRGSIAYVRHGPILQNPSVSLYKKIIGDLIQLGKKFACDCVRISPLTDDKCLVTSLEAFHAKKFPIHGIDAQRCHVLDLLPDEQQLLADMRKSTRYDIRKAEKLGIHVTCTSSKKDVVSFFALYKETARRQHFIQHDGIQEEFDAYAKYNNAEIFLAYHQKEILAGALIIYDQFQAIYHHGASIPGPIPAASLIQWEAIKQAKKRNMSLYNFWGVSAEGLMNHPWYGLSLFKRGFGGREIVWNGSYDISLTPRYIIIHALDMYKKFTQHF